MNAISLASLQKSAQYCFAQVGVKSDNLGLISFDCCDDLYQQIVFQHEVPDVSR